MKRHRLIPGCLALIAGCGGLGAREASVHDVMISLGHGETVPGSAASLDRGGHMQFPLHLESGSCVALVAMGGRHVDDLDIEVLREDGRQIARDTNVGRDATAIACGTRTEDVEVVVTARHGHGDVRVSAYSVSGEGGVGMGLATSCEAAEVIQPGATIEGTTTVGRHFSDGSCFQGGSPEVFYRIEVPVLSIVSLDLQSRFDGALVLLRDCGGAEIACNDDFQAREHSHIDAELEPGTYVVAVDGFGGESGAFRLQVTMNPSVPVAQLCTEAPLLTPGTAVDATTVGSFDRFAASCAGGARSPDRVHRLEVTSTSRVRVVQRSPEHDGALYLRRSCQEDTSEVACNDDWGGTDASVITTRLDAGTYYVYADGFSGDSAASGPYSLLAEVGPADGAGTSSDSCDGASAAVAGANPIDTFSARDDLAGSCGGQGGADVVRRLSLPGRSRVVVRANRAQFNGAVYLRRATCNGEEIACRTFSLSGGSGPTDVLGAVLEPGEYFLVVDGADVESFGSVDLDITIEDTRALDAMCRELPLLTPGRDVEGDTRGAARSFSASCAGNAESPDRGYRLVVRRRSLVRLELTSREFDGALHVRRSCADDVSEVACNDDADGDTGRSVIEMNLDPGTYTVIVDGFSSDNMGAYTLRATLSNPRTDAPEPDEARPPRDRDNELKRAGKPTRHR